MNVADELCDRVAFLVDGEIKLIDTPRALKVRHGQRRIQVEFGLNGQWQQQEFALDGLGRNPEFMNLLQRDDIKQSILRKRLWSGFSSRLRVKSLSKPVHRQQNPSNPGSPPVYGSQTQRSYDETFNRHHSTGYTPLMA